MIVQTLVALGVFCAFFAVVSAETCKGKDDCKLTLCSPGIDLICDTNAKLCTCVKVCHPEANLSRCTTANDCIAEYEKPHTSFICDCPEYKRDLHCIDRRCHCKYPPN